ncbi:hypothetical protein Q4485_08375 [Granulosicoccaceae sp. 1_MG-2023]|nr:hypothetical protein [Granulosicoccaceae sp. 1_MG-2023]
MPTGPAIAAIPVLYLLSLLPGFSLLPATLVAWYCGYRVIPFLSTTAKRQCATLLAGGLALLLYGVWQGAWLGWEKVFAANVPILAMFISIAFLSLATEKPAEDSLPRGPVALAATAVGTNLLGAVINISVLFVFGDRLQCGGKLAAAHRILLARSFCAAAWWSPYFVATGVALTYAPGMQWQDTLWPGLLMTGLSIGFTLLDLRLRGSSGLPGYPVHVRSLVMPVSLALAVLLAHNIWPQVSVLVLICLLSFPGALLFMRQRPRLPAVAVFARERLQGQASQIALFLSASVFSAGVVTLLRLHPDWLAIQADGFTPLVFLLVSGVMIAVALIGVHPIVSVSVVSPLLLPLQPDMTLLGFMYLSVWAISTASSPLSGVGLAMVGRYGAGVGAILRNNWYYMVLMWLTASALAWML